MRGRAVANLLHMGHCAPTVIQTRLDVSNANMEWLVRLSAGMPGAIGNTGHECGAMTSPLVLLGLRHGPREMDRGLPQSSITSCERGYAYAVVLTREAARDS